MKKQQASRLFSRNCDVRIPGEFERQEALVFGCGQLVRFYPQTFVDFVSLTHRRTRLIGVIDPKYRRLAEILLGAAGLPRTCVHFVARSTSAMWVRDFSPHGAVDRRGRRVFLRFHHGHMRNRDDLQISEVFEQSFGGEFRDIDLNLEGGNLLSNGAGLLISSKTIVLQNQQRADVEGIGRLLDRTAGGVQWAAANPLIGERTGHIDLMAAFLSHNLLVVGQVEGGDQAENARSLDDLASSLNGLQTGGGRLRVVRVPMPFSGDTYFRSYCNLLFVNGLLVVPIYPSVDPKLDQRVLAQFARLMPKWEVVGLDCDEIIRKGGGLHCMTANIPCQPKRFAPRADRGMGAAPGDVEILPR